MIIISLNDFDFFHKKPYYITSFRKSRNRNYIFSSELLFLVYNYFLSDISYLKLWRVPGIKLRFFDLRILL